MTSDNLQHWIQDPSTLTKDTLYELRNLLARYPYFQPARLLYLKNLYLLHDITFGAELRKSALYISDLKSLFYFIEGDNYRLNLSSTDTAVDVLEQPTTGIDRTLVLIDAFLATVSEDFSDQQELDYTTDYAGYMLQTTPDSTAADTAEEPKSRDAELIDGFLQKSEQGETFKQHTIESAVSSSPVLSYSVDSTPDESSGTDSFSQSKSDDDNYFTETLAKIYIKQGRYEKSLEIIKKLSLKYPKKNAYFADQIRFLEKLIINANSK